MKFRNSDEDLRRLEREAKTGGEGERVRYRRALVRAGRLSTDDPAKLWLLARMNAPERRDVIAVLNEVPPVAPGWEDMQVASLDFSAHFATLVAGDVYEESAEGRPLPGHRLRTRIGAVIAVRQAARDLIRAQASGDAAWEQYYYTSASLADSFLGEIHDDKIYVDPPTDCSCGDTDCYVCGPEAVAARRELSLRPRLSTVTRAFAQLVHGAEQNVLLPAVELLYNSAAFAEYMLVPNQMLGRAMSLGLERDEIDYGLLSSLILEDAASVGFSMPPEQVDVEEGPSGFYALGTFSRDDVRERFGRYVMESLLAWLRDQEPPMPPSRNKLPGTRNNPRDEEIQSLRRLASTGDKSAKKQLYFALERAGEHLPPDEEFGVLELILDDHDLPEEEVVRRHEERLRAGLLTTRERWLIEKLGAHDPATALSVARLMRKLELDPWGSNPGECMEEIAEVLGADRGVDAFDRPGDGEPLYVYVAWEDWNRPTLFWGFTRNKFSISTTEDVARRVDSWTS